MFAILWGLYKAGVYFILFKVKRHARLVLHGFEILMFGIPGALAVYSYTDFVHLYKGNLILDYFRVMFHLWSIFFGFLYLFALGFGLFFLIRLSIKFIFKRERRKEIRKSIKDIYNAGFWHSEKDKISITEDIERYMPNENNFMIFLYIFGAKFTSTLLYVDAFFLCAIVLAWIRA